MDNKFACGDKVRIKATGKEFRISGGSGGYGLNRITYSGNVRTGNKWEDKSFTEDELEFVPEPMIDDKMDQVNLHLDFIRKNSQDYIDLCARGESCWEEKSKCQENIRRLLLDFHRLLWR